MNFQKKVKIIAPYRSQSPARGQEMSCVVNLESNQALSALFVLLTVPIAVSEDLFELKVFRHCFANLL